MDIDTTTKLNQLATLVNKWKGKGKGDVYWVIDRMKARQIVRSLKGLVHSVISDAGEVFRKEEE